MLLLKRTALVALSKRFLMTQIRLVLMLYFFMVANKANAEPCRRPVEVYVDMVEVLQGLKIFLTENA